MIRAKDLAGAVVMLGLILAAAIAANRALDAFDIANEPGATVEQKKLRARERQWDWDHYQSRRSDALGSQSVSSGDPAKMCADPSALATAKVLINDQYPSAAKLGSMIETLEAARPKRTIAQEWESIEQQKTLWTSMGSRPEAKDELAKLEVRAAKLREREKQESEGKAASPPPSQQTADNEVIVQAPPYPIEYDRDLKRVACRVQYRISGPAYETINAIRGNVLNVGIYTVQPGQDDWIVELISVTGNRD